MLCGYTCLCLCVYIFYGISYLMFCFSLSLYTRTYIKHLQSHTMNSYRHVACRHCLSSFTYKTNYYLGNYSFIYNFSKWQKTMSSLRCHEEVLERSNRKSYSISSYCVYSHFSAKENVVCFALGQRCCLLSSYLTFQVFFLMSSALLPIYICCCRSISAAIGLHLSL